MKRHFLSQVLKEREKILTDEIIIVSNFKYGNFKLRENL